MPKITPSDKKKLPKKYHELPRYPSITYGYERVFKKNYYKTLDKMFLGITKQMLSV